MTGFGRAVEETESVRVGVRLRCVNHRFFDLSLRLPEEWGELESAVRNLLADRIHRGRVEARVDLDDRRQRDVQVRIDRAVLTALQEAQAELQEILPIEEIALRDLVRIPNAIKISAAAPTESPEIADQLLRAVDSALAEVERAREREGAQLASALSDRLDTLGAIVGSIAARTADVQRELGERFAARWSQLLETPGVLDEGRLAQETALMVERSDIQEEVDRLRTHEAHFRETLGEEGPVGKRLDFLAQEIFRELNTLATKCRHSDVVKLVIDAKLLCEQLREQVQNVE
jgi:uncharacterized protein (TIGR00255 family)